MIHIISVMYDVQRSVIDLSLLVSYIEQNQKLRLISRVDNTIKCLCPRVTQSDSH